MKAVTEPRWPVVLFDLDGTIANTIGLIAATYRHTIEIAADVRSIAVTWGAGTAEALHAAAPDHLCASVVELRRVLLG